MKFFLSSTNKRALSKLAAAGGFAVVAMFASGIQGCGTSNAKEEGTENKKAVVETPALETFNLQRGKLNSSLQMPGELISFQQVDLYAKVSSFIKKLYVDVGSEVKTGQLLALMEAPEINSQLAAAES